MLTHPILDKLQTLRFHGMLTALQEQMQMPDIEGFAFEERLGLLVDREMTERENRRYKTRLSKARLKQQACLEDVDFTQKGVLTERLFCSWRPVSGSKRPITS